jgi:hypothetical protein
MVLYFVLIVDLARGIVGFRGARASPQRATYPLKGRLSLNLCVNLLNFCVNLRAS